MSRLTLLQRFGICRRRGLGKVRHLAVADLWIQEKLRAQDFILSKIPGQQNPADLFTNVLDRPTMDRLMPLLSVEFEDGRADSAPQLAHMVNAMLRIWL